MDLEKLNRPEQEIVKVKGIIGTQLLFIFAVYVGNLQHAKISPRVQPELLRRHHLFLRVGNSRQKSTLPILFRIDLKEFADVLHQRLLVVRIIDRKIGVIPQKRDMPSQNPHAHRMERADPDALRAKSNHPVHPLPHLPRGLVCKRNRKDIPGVHPLLVNQVRNPVGQDPGLPGTGPRQDEERPLRVENRLPLPVIQSIIHTQNTHFLSHSFGINCRLFLLYHKIRRSTLPFFIILSVILAMRRPRSLCKADNISLSPRSAVHGFPSR